MDKIFKDANEQRVATTIVYKKANETYAYADAACTIRITTSELKNLFIKGVVAKLEDGTLVKPIRYDEKTYFTYLFGYVYYIKPNSTTDASADIARLGSTPDPE